jgi:hypothetical protein
LLVGGFPHFLWRRRVDFFGGHYSGFLFRELGRSSPSHNFQLFIRFLPIFVGGNWCKQLKNTHSLGAFEISVRAVPLKGYGKCPPFWIISQKGANCL